MIIEITNLQSQKVNKLIRKACCNCINGNCLLLDHECVQLNSCENIYCQHFIRAVLPSDKSLCNEILETGLSKACINCGSYFIPNSNSQKYCKECSGKTRRNYMRKYMQDKAVGFNK